MRQDSDGRPGPARGGAATRTRAHGRRHPARPGVGAAPADTGASQRRRAAVLSEDIAQRLADPRQVREWLPHHRHPARALTLGDGMPGIALLHLERGTADGHARHTAHRWLSDAAGLARTTPDDVLAEAPGLYRGVPALSFALTRAALVSGRPLAAAERLAGHVRTLARTLAGRQRRRRPQDGARGDNGTYDVLSGLAGLGAHLLDPRVRDCDALAEVLAALTGLTAPLRLDGRTLPGWWTGRDRGGPATAEPGTGHADPGMAHGASGPLALLALAWEAGATVPGQEHAIRTLAAWLMAVRRHDGEAVHWPSTLTPGPDGTVVAGESAPGRPSWCHGTVGIARALYLAGRALDVPEWRDTAVTAWRSALAGARHTYDGPVAGRLADAGLCHGWSGVLQATWRMADDTRDAALRAQLPWLAERVLDLADIDDPFGLVPPLAHGGLAADPAGFLTGAAGAALALRTFATDTAPATHWDRALLLA
ncbi:lanthionine synthetase C family protein [Streptomyces sp. ISL-11]|uniref:lanthionine synthetase C family protein n=1 Tax=Streptomyces sp. ISL-11 TaxID=2819174 RepID=UPI001BEC88D1|nr:lanthionine synthetase C family protein [Streptomyces sp. ISL-11]MBT2384938.1 lanthionine synthetase C family protein [Streptomyces sp. ISL-11]